MTWDVILHTLQSFGVQFSRNSNFQIGNRLLLLSEGAFDCPETIYIAKEPVDCGAFHHALVISVGVCSVEHDNLIVLAECDLFQVFNGLTLTKSWLDGLVRGLAVCDSDQEIIDCASDYTGLPMFYLDESYRILAITNITITGDPEWKHMSEKRYLSPGNARRMKVSGDLDFLAPSLIPVIYCSEIYPFDSVVCNLWLEGKFVSRLNVLCVDGNTSPVICRASELVAIHLKRLLTKNRSLAAGSPVQRILLDLLHGIPLPEEMIRESLKGTPALAESLFQLFYVDMEAREDRQLASYYAGHLKQQFSGQKLIPVEFKGQLILLIYGENEPALDSVIAELDHFFATHHLHCGASNPFRNLSTLQGYFQQSVAALSKVHEGEGVCFYRDIMLEHMLSHIPDEKLPYLISPDISRLQKAEREYSFSLVDTLRTYLDCDCNLNRAAERMFIHKNTLLYRMNHIRSVIRCDLNDPDERMLLMLSFKLLERN